MGICRVADKACCGRNAFEKTDIYFMNLIVDIGNSTVKVAVMNDNAIVMHRRLGNEPTDGLAMIVEDIDIDACAYSSVGKPLPNLEAAIRHLIPNTLKVTGLTPTPLLCDYRTPETLGADRLAVAVGAAACVPGKPLLVVDAGTCVTYEYVSADGHYLGGNISPGLGIRLRSLHEQTALLPLVGNDERVPTIGYDTPSAIRAGVIRGMNYEIEGCIRDFKRHEPDGVVFITGGNGFRFANEMEVERNESLVEIGLNAILNYNRL